MKVKIFFKSEFTEGNIQKWLDENPDIEIQHIRQSVCGGDITLTILYYEDDDD